MRRDGVPPDPLELVHGRPEGHCAHDVGRAGLLALGWIGPDHLVQVDQVDGATAGEEGIALFEDAPRPNEGTGAERRVELVAAEGDEVGSRRQGSMGRQLRRIEQDGDAARLRLGTDLLHGRQPAGDVGGTRQGQEGRSPPVLEHPHHVGRVEGAVGAALHPAPSRHARPGQQVGVVLDHRGGHHVAWAEPQPVGQLVDGLGGVAHQDHHVVSAGRSPREAVHAVSRPLVGGGGTA